MLVEFTCGMRVLPLWRSCRQQTSCSMCGTCCIFSTMTTTKVVTSVLKSSGIDTDRRMVEVWNKSYLLSGDATCARAVGSPQAELRDPDGEHLSAPIRIHEQHLHGGSFHWQVAGGIRVAEVQWFHGVCGTVFYAMSLNGIFWPSGRTQSLISC